MIWTMRLYIGLDYLQIHTSKNKHLCCIKVNQKCLLCKERRQHPGLFLSCRKTLYFIWITLYFYCYYVPHQTVMNNVAEACKKHNSLSYVYSVMLLYNNWITQLSCSVFSIADPGVRCDVWADRWCNTWSLLWSSQGL